MSILEDLYNGTICPIEHIFRRIPIIVRLRPTLVKNVIFLQPD